MGLRILTGYEVGTEPRDSHAVLYCSTSGYVLHPLFHARDEGPFAFNGVDYDGSAASVAQAFIDWLAHVHDVDDARSVMTLNGYYTQFIRTIIQVPA